VLSWFHRRKLDPDQVPGNTATSAPSRYRPLQETVLGRYNRSSPLGHRACHSAPCSRHRAPEAWRMRAKNHSATPPAVGLIHTWDLVKIPIACKPTTTCNPATKGASPSQHRPVPDPPAALRLSAAASVTRQPQPTRYICHCERSAAIPSPRQTPLMVNPSSHYLCLSLRECLVHSRQSRRSMGGVTHHQSRHRVGANSHSPLPLNASGPSAHPCPSFDPSA
jgi:hypothetical protein